ncbi:shikimate 5-dehydrogenase [Desulfatibacillum aliphaticivorans]|uniref:Shikimate dehydrogenase (NADP(+)) n=1 Tax=Desulfatibacillum aliphaticivorans TaxID=218208 RepID=B8FFQ3_DESAL|nr:shikimate dehydrogenase [Desulfatibacillum aliphaticivorans]ACL03458.1 shikimate 5-dehydrogenase [Desulfatibacillum aliphaticivorans]
MTVEINSLTRLYAVFGDPVAHSLSPAMHNRAFTHIGENAAYMAFRVKDVQGAVRAIRAFDMGGASVTIPHKISVMEHLDEVDETARAMGAVNTIVNDQGRLIGKNSDCLGAVKAIQEKTPVKGKDVVVIGAGGAARAVIYGLKQEGARVTIVNRTMEKGAQLAEELGVDFQPMEDLGKLDCRIAVNATSVGMVPNVQDSPAPASLFNKEMLAMDIVYRPLLTRFLSDARDAGCTIVDGIAMFVYQGASQFEWWTGKEAPVAQMRETVETILGQR